jgi:hypothetical protein
MTGKQSRLDPNKRQRQPCELHSDSKTVRYELENLVGLAINYSSDGKDNPYRNNAYVEAFALHCRALIYFLYGHLDEIEANGEKAKFSGLRDNDVLAWDFHRQWDQECPSAKAILVESKWRADKHVAHITTERREVNQSGGQVESVWMLSDATSAICDVMDCFLSKAPAQNFDASALQIMQDRIATWRYRSTATPHTGFSRSLTTSAGASTSGLQATTGGGVVSKPPKHSFHGKTG